MPNHHKTTPDRMVYIRAYLEKKSKKELVILLLDLVQGMDEPTRQRFWEHLAPPGMATADLRYPSAEDFLAELEDFADEVSEGKYYDEEAAIYYGEDNYNETDEYDPDDHVGVKALRTFFHEADSYFDAGQFEIARQAYIAPCWVKLPFTKADWPHSGSGTRASWKATSASGQCEPRWI